MRIIRLAVEAHFEAPKTLVGVIEVGEIVCKKSTKRRERTFLTKTHLNVDYCTRNLWYNSFPVATRDAIRKRLYGV